MFANLFEQRTARRIPVRQLKATILGSNAPPLACVNLSSHGVCLDLPFACAVGQDLQLELAHPHLPKLQLPAGVRWCRALEGSEQLLAGLEFLVMTPANRRAVRRFLAAEAGSCVLPDRAAPPVGFVAQSSNVWSFFDGNATRMAVLSPTESGFKLTLGRAGPRGTVTEAPVETVAEAIQHAYGVPHFLLDPAQDGIEVTPPAAPATPPATPPPPPVAAPAPAYDGPSVVAPAPGTRLSGSCVMQGAQPRGYVARTGKGEWGLFDEAQEQIGVLSQRGNTFTVFWLGESVEDSFESLEATNFASAVAAAFELDGFPRLVSAVLQPKSLITKPTPSEAHKKAAPGNRVLHHRRVVGFVCPSDMPGIWMLINKDQEQVALINKEEHLFRVCFLGNTAEESLDFEDHEDLLDALASAFDLDSRPLVDPPLEVATGG